MNLRKIFAAVAIAAVAWTMPVQPAAAQDVYGTPGVHLVNGRYWKTTCAHYSTTVVRCTTDIYATKVFLENGRWYKQNTWVFNNLSYLPSSRGQWASNPLGRTGSWTTSDGRKWRTECDTAATGRGACRNYLVATIASESGGVVKQSTGEVFNSMVRFSTASLPPVTRIPASAPALAGVPAPGPKQAIGVVPAPAPVTAPKPAPVVSGRAAPYASGECPSSHPIKGNANSGIYHMPYQQYYTRTKAEDCFSSEGAARDAGYRKAKV